MKDGLSNYQSVVVMNPNKERDQMWLIKTLWGFWGEGWGWAAELHSKSMRTWTISPKIICKPFC